MEINKTFSLKENGTKQVYQRAYFEGKETENIRDYITKIHRYNITLQDFSKKLNKRIFLVIFTN